jgi:hypothetical protein
MSYTLIGYDCTFDMAISYGVFSSMENAKKSMEELVLYHINKITESEYFICGKTVLDQHVLMEEELIFRKTLHIITNGDIDKLIYPD